MTAHVHVSGPLGSISRGPKLDVEPAADERPFTRSIGRSSSGPNLRLFRPIC